MHACPHTPTNIYILNSIKDFRENWCLWLKITFQKYKMPQRSKSNNLAMGPKSFSKDLLLRLETGQDEWAGVCECVSAYVCLLFLYLVQLLELHVCLRQRDASWTVLNSYCLFHWYNPLVFPRTSRFASFPEYLVVQIKKFTFGLDWVPKKFGRYLLHAFA